MQNFPTVLGINSYNCLPVQELKLNNYSIVPIRYTDIQEIRCWRNDQIDILRQTKKVTKNEQTEYYNKIIKKSFGEKKPDCILFSYFLDDKCIGYGGFVHINWKKKRAELSFILDTEHAKKVKIYQKEFRIFLRLIFRLNREQIKFKIIFTETYYIRTAHLEILEDFGFKRIKRMSNEGKIIDGKTVDSVFHEYREILN